MTHESNPEFEAAIRDNPDDQSIYAVYGDWLQSRGDPLGEAVSLHLVLAAEPDNAAAQAALQTLFANDPEYFFGPKHEDAYEQEPSYEVWEGWARPKTWPKQSWTYGFARALWRFGFIERLYYDTGYYDEASENDSAAAAAWLVKMLAAPSARFVREISIGELWADYRAGAGPLMGEAIAAITASPCAITLRRLDFLGGEHDLSGVDLDVQGLSDACPNLEDLQLYAGTLTIDKLAFPKLRRFAAQTGGLDTTAMKTICEASFPLIEDLEIWFGSENYGANCTIDDVRPLLAKEMPHLKRLGLMNSEFADDICRAVVDWPLLGQLEKLDLSMGVMTDDGGRALIDAKSKLAHLEHLKVRGYFSKDVAAQLSGLARDRSIDVEKPDRTYRYVEVGE